MNSQAEAVGKWYRLDNAANVYPAIKNKKRPNLFRVSATLRGPIEPERLQHALDITLKRIPSFSVQMRSGLFWHYFSHSEEQVRILEDVINPCMSLSSNKDNGFQIRVRHHDRRIGLEVFHSVSDGSGAMVFLKTLVAQYLTLGGVNVPATHGVLNCDGTSRPAETVDDFGAFAGRSTPKRERQRRAYHVSGTKLPYHDLDIITGTVPVNGLKDESRRHNVSITEYLTGVFLFVLYSFQRAEQRRHPLPVSVQVPVNLRQFHPSETLRNFSSYVCPSIDPTQGDYTFEEILSSVHHFMRYEVTAKQLHSRVATNIQAERNPFLRMLPLFVKNRAISLGYRLAGPAIYSSVLSNLGVVQVPPPMAAHVEMFDFILGPSQVTNIDCAVLGYDGKLRITFTRAIAEAFVERAFFTFLVRRGIPVKVESNKEQNECPTV
jgi:NRPS condensation-like uncharacterized protein